MDGRWLTAKITEVDGAPTYVRGAERNLEIQATVQSLKRKPASEFGKILKALKCLGWTKVKEE